MGDPSKPRKKFAKPLKPYDKSRIEEEAEIVKKYGLKNKRELWTAKTTIDTIRSQVKKLILHPEEKDELFNRLLNLGLINPESTIDDVLALAKENLLERRLQTIVFKKGLAKTVKEARQMIIHRKIKVLDRTITIPGYLVKVNEEMGITLLSKKEKVLKEKTISQINEDAINEEEKNEWK